MQHSSRTQTQSHIAVSYPATPTTSTCSHHPDPPAQIATANTAAPYRDSPPMTPSTRGGDHHHHRGRTAAADYLSKWTADWRSTLLLAAPLLLLLILVLSYASALSLPHFRLRRGAAAPELARARIAVCVVGGARRFELTGPSIVKHVLRVYPGADLFLHSPLDENAYKLSLLKRAPRIAAVRVFVPAPIEQTEAHERVLTARNSPNGVQGLLQYFNLVEGCLSLITAHELQQNFTYDWIVRTRVDGYWSAPLDPSSFQPGTYMVPPGSRYGGLNDRLGIGDRSSSFSALARLSLIPALDAAGYQCLNSESAFKSQLAVTGVMWREMPASFCIVSDRSYGFPPDRYGVPVASMGSPGPLSGAKCRPCKATCKGTCVEEVAWRLETWWSWTEWRNGSLELCDASREWDDGWEAIFDSVAGSEAVQARKRMKRLNLARCVRDFKAMRRRTAIWDAPPDAVTCGLGLNRTNPK